MATKIYVHCDNDHIFRLGETPSENFYIIVERVTDNRFLIVGDNITEDGDWIVNSVALGFYNWSDKVIDLDGGASDASQCFNISQEISCGDVIFTPDEIHANSIEEIVQEVKNFSFCAWCPGDI